MNHFDSESKILEKFRFVKKSESFPNSPNAKRIFNSIHNKSRWKKWIDASNKSTPPPDYYSDDFKLMMEVMRIDDHAYVDEKTGKIINPVSKRESEIQRELRDSEVFKSYPNVENTLIIPYLPELSAKEYRNYGRYKNNFIRVIEKHKKQIQSYRKNHPGYKLIFFVMDESEEYVKVKSEYIANKERFLNEFMSCERHVPMRDEILINAIKESGIDFFVWYMPYKVIQTQEMKLDSSLPKVCVIDVAHLKKNPFSTQNYDERLMVSSGI